MQTLISLLDNKAPETEKNGNYCLNPRILYSSWRTFPNQLIALLKKVVISMGECNTILSAYTLYRHLG